MNYIKKEDLKFKMTNTISITGDLGSGKSTVSNILRKRLKFSYIYTGDIQRKIAERYNMTTTELNKYSETHPEIDEEIDSTFRSLNNANDLIVDSRLAWFFMPDSFKIYLKTNIKISAERISNDKQRKNETYFSIEEAIVNIKERKKSENKRYKELYDANCSDLNNFNLIIDTSYVTPEKVAEIILFEYNRWLNNRNDITQTYISPYNLYPTQSIRGFGSDYFKDLCSSIRREGFNPTYPIVIVNYDFLDYIIDGHKRTACAIKNKVELIPVKFISYDNFLSDGLSYKDEIINSLKQSYLYDWEDFNSFRYILYPEF